MFAAILTLIGCKELPTPQRPVDDKFTAIADADADADAINQNASTYTLEATPKAPDAQMQTSGVLQNSNFQ